MHRLFRCVVASLEVVMRKSTSVRTFLYAVGAVVAAVLLTAASSSGTSDPGIRPKDPDGAITQHALDALQEGRQTFRFDTFGDEAFWGDTLRLHEAIEGSAHGGVGPGLSPRAALEAGLKVDVDKLPGSLQSDLRHGRVNLDDPAVTLALLKLNAVVGVTGFFQSNGHLRSVGLQCAICHSDRRQFLRAGHRASPRRLGQPRPERRRRSSTSLPISPSWTRSSASTTRRRARCC